MVLNTYLLYATFTMQCYMIHYENFMIQFSLVNLNILLHNVQFLQIPSVPYLHNAYIHFPDIRFISQLYERADKIIFLILINGDSMVLTNGVKLTFRLHGIFF